MAKLTRETLKQFRHDFDVTAQLFENKYGIKLSLGAIKFSDTEFHGKLSGIVADPFGEAARSVNTDVVVRDPSTYNTAGPGDQYIDSMARAQGLSLEISPKGFVGSMYKLPGKRSAYTITGINPRAPKYCVEVITETGARYRMPLTALARAALVGHKE